MNATITTDTVDTEVTGKQAPAVRCYDNGGATIDRYTAVYTEPYHLDGVAVYSDVCMSGMPYHPQGVCQHGESVGKPIDRPSGKHLGKRIAFDALPVDCQRVILADLATEDE